MEIGVYDLLESVECSCEEWKEVVRFRSLQQPKPCKIRYALCRRGGGPESLSCRRERKYWRLWVVVCGGPGGFGSAWSVEDGASCGSVDLKVG